ncbi:MAG TPA: DNA polymerase IV [Caldilinea sp.]|nr:DNA polymerase IV [Caldilinea sp.]
MRKIIHLDLDAFFCAVEELRDPTLRGKPFAVGGQPESRGVVASCSYAARRFGVHSALPMGQALRLCPTLLIVPVRHSEYAAASRRVMAILHTLTPRVEQISIDEAFLDVTDRPQAAAALAVDLQQAIRRDLGLPVSLGVAANKLVAKIANNVGKAAARGDAPPSALLVVPPGDEATFLAPLPADALWGVGPKTAARLEALGIHTIGDIAHWPERDLVQRFGKHGQELARHACGLDDRPVVTEHERKSISQETTFVRDVTDAALLRATLQQQAEEVAAMLRRQHLLSATVKLKLRWADFTTLTRQMTLPQPSDDAAQIHATACILLERAWQQQAVRLIGVGVSGLSEARQLSLWEPPNARAENLYTAVKEVRKRYGESALRRASDLDDHAAAIDEKS